MIRPPRFRGTAFTEAGEGDLRFGDRLPCSQVLGVSADWATVHQVHGGKVSRVDRAGSSGAGDGLYTTRVKLPLAVFTADCLGVVVEADGAVGVAHAGWRGLLAGVLGALTTSMASMGEPPRRAAVGPSIGPCCFEVGPEVADEFPGLVARTTWGTTSVDLWGAARSALTDVPEVWVAERCTRCDSELFSHRRDGTPSRLAAIGWIP